MSEPRFGAAPLEGGGVRFRLWAPSAERVELLLGETDAERVVEMQAAADGWFQRTVADAAPGDLYRFRPAGGPAVPDPASRFQPRDVHGPSRVEPRGRFEWSDVRWQGRPWEETVVYELHAGAFSEQGGFEGVRSRLDHLAALGVTAVELMPIADFPGARNWGYDGVLPFAPDTRYGSPDELRRLVDAAHSRGLMVFLDVVYNHFGPEGNYLHLYARRFFNPRHPTPWGDAINFDGPGNRQVRDFFIENALYWLEEFGLDGLRLDAVHAIRDESTPGFLDELARAVRSGPGSRRHVHLVLENDANEASRLAHRDGGYVAQWNDDLHHALHCLLTGESGGYYRDYSDDPARHLARALAEGFAYQGEASRYRGGRPRGEPSGGLAPTSFVNFLQNHDQVGNRAFGERLTELTERRKLRAAVATVLLCPAPPLLFMGEEFGCRQPFPFFCDFGPDLAHAVSEGRRREFARFEPFSDAAARMRIPDPGDELTFRSAVLDWTVLDRAPHRDWLEFYRTLLTLRRREVVPRLAGCRGGSASWTRVGERAIRVDWTLGDGSRLRLLANLGDEPVAGVQPPEGHLLLAVENGEVTDRPGSRVAPWSCAWFRDDRTAT